MDIRKLCLLCLSFLSAFNVYAQAEKKDSTVQDNKGVLITLTDGIATTVRHTGRKIRKVGKEFNAIDTTYISPNLYNLAFMLESSSWYEYYRLGSKGNNGEQSLGFSPNASFKLGVYFGWRWIFLGYSFDVKDIFGGHKNKAKKTEMALNLYSSKFGVDLYYRKTGSDFKIRSSSGFDLNTPIKNLNFNGWYEYYRLGSKGNNGEQSLGFSPNASFKLGVYFGWRWIFLGYSFDVKDIFGGHKNKAKKTEMALNLYSSKFGVDLYYRKTGSDFKIRSSSGFDLNTPIKNLNFNGLQSKIKGLNAYWIFNYKKFSYPAAYSQSTNQRKSAGSLMAGFSYSQHNISFDYEKLPGEVRVQLHDALLFKKVKYSDYSINVGYGYNWVFAKNWVSNLSLLPAIAYKKSKIDDTPNTDNHWIKDINFDLITRAAVVYNTNKYFIGASLVMHTYDYRKKDFSLTNTFGTVRIYAGFNFWKKKEFRDK